MKHKPVIAGIIFVVVIAVIIVVVRSRLTEVVVPPEKPPVAGVKPDTFQAFSERINEMLGAGDTNGAVRAMTAACGDGRYGEDTPRVLGRLISVLVRADRVGEAEAKFIEAAGRGPELIHNAFGIIYVHKLRSGDNAAVFEWTKQLFELGLPERDHRRAFAWHLDACYRFAQRKRARELVPQCIREFPAAQSADILQYLANGLIERKKLDAARGLTTMIGESGKSIPELVKLARILRVRIAIEAGEWGNILVLVMRSAEVMSDRELGLLSASVYTKALAQDRAGVVEQLCEYLLMEQKDKATTVREAARQWIAIPKKYGKADEIPERLGFLKKMGVASDVRTSLFRSEFYYVLEKAGPGGIAAMVKRGDELSSELPAGDDKERIKVMLVDGCYMTEDYERALVILEAGIEGREDRWTKMAKDKVRAHMALKQGDVDEAVNWFRKFMAHVAKWQDPEIDPSTGIRHTKEMTLGFNAKRIAGIYKDAGRMEEAQTAYMEARDYYEKALEETRQGSKSRKLIEKELADLPGKAG